MDRVEWLDAHVGLPAGVGGPTGPVEALLAGHGGRALAVRQRSPLPPIATGPAAPSVAVGMSRLGPGARLSCLCRCLGAGRLGRCLGAAGPAWSAGSARVLLTAQGGEARAGRRRRALV